MSLLRLVHLGDLHAQSTHPRNADRLAALDQVIEREHGQQVNAWLMPGDLLHARSTVQDRNDLAARLTRMADRAPVWLCYGNHDAPGDLDIFGALRARHLVTVIHKPMVVDLASAVCAMRVGCFVLPYPSKAGLVAAGVEHESLNAETSKAFDLMFMEAAASFDAYRASGAPVLMIGHVSIGGAISSVGQPQIGTELEISQAHLDRLGDCPKLLNHIHKHQYIGGAVYAGSLCRLDWGEVEPKGYIVAEYETCPTKHWAVRFVELNVPPMYHVEAELTWLPPGSERVGFVYEQGCYEIFFKVTRGPEGEIIPMPDTAQTFQWWRGADVRVRVRYRAAERDRLDGGLLEIRKKFTEARRCEIEPIIVPDRALRAPEVVAAKTLDEKLKAWADVSGVTWAGEIVTRATELQSGESATVIAGVTERMARLADVGALLAG